MRDATDLTPLVGREVELAYLSAIFDKVAVQVGTPVRPSRRRARHRQEPPGARALAHVDARPEMTTWRQGYCPPFGEDVTYWALAEIVKGHAGIRDTDHEAAVEAKLEAVRPRFGRRSGSASACGRSVGLPASGGVARGELRRLDCASSRAWPPERPTVLVFEDLHWADEALARLPRVPHDAPGDGAAAGRRDGATGALRAAAATSPPAAPSTRVDLRPLSTEETTRLVARLLAAGRTGACRRRGRRALRRQPLLRRAVGAPAGGLARARPCPTRCRPSSPPASTRCRPTQKALLGDAAVVGSVFWSGALAAIGARDRDDGLEEALSGLLERRLIRRVRESSMEGEREYAFAHALARDVAYRQLPRAKRARGHKLAAEWLEGRAGKRAGDLVEILSHHYLTALELAEATGDQDLRSSLIAPLLRNLELAGKRAMVLDVVAAERYFSRAMELTLDDAEEARASRPVGARRRRRRTLRRGASGP